MISARNLALLFVFAVGGVALAGCPDNNKPGSSPAGSASAAAATAPGAASGAASAKPTTGSGW